MPFMSSKKRILFSFLILTIFAHSSAQALSRMLSSLRRSSAQSASTSPTDSALQRSPSTASFSGFFRNQDSTIAKNAKSLQKLIASTIQQNATNLDLSQYNFEELKFPEIPDCVTALNLSMCRLREIPKNVKTLTNLTELILDNNFRINLDGLPENVKHLSAYACDLQKFPDNFSALNLESLNISGNIMLWKGVDLMLQLPQTLIDLDIQACDLRGKDYTVHFERLQNLTKLKIYGNPALYCDIAQLSSRVTIIDTPCDRFDFFA